MCKLQKLNHAENNYQFLEYAWLSRIQDASIDFPDHGIGTLFVSNDIIYNDTALFCNVPGNMTLRFAVEFGP